MVHIVAESKNKSKAVHGVPTAPVATSLFATAPPKPLSARGCQTQLQSGDNRVTHTLLRTSDPINCLSHVVATIMVSSKVILVYRQHPLQHLRRILVFAEFSVGQRQIVEGDCNIKVILHIVLHLDIDDAFEDVRGLVVVPSPM